jgi:signal transduction histidine kinase
MTRRSPTLPSRRPWLGRSSSFVAGAPPLETAHVVASAAVGPDASFDLAAVRANPLHVAEAEREVMRRSVVSTVTQTVMLVSVQLAFPDDAPRWLHYPSIALIVTFALLRTWSMLLIHRDQRPRLRRWLFPITSLGMAALWGVVEASHLASRGATFEMLVITVCVCGIAMGLMITFAPAPRMQLATLLALMTPVPVWSIAQGDVGAWAILHIAYFLYGTVQGRVIYRDYWRAIGTSDLLTRHAESLRKANADRRQLQESLRFAERMSSLGTLAAGVAHEINNPMTYVLGNLDYIAEELARHPAPAWSDADAPLAQLIGEAQDGARRVVRIVRDLKTFSRHSEDDPLEPIDLESTLETAAGMARSQIRHRARLERSYRGATRVLGDNVRLGQVFVNLVINAAQAIPEGDEEKHRIVLRTYLDDRGQAVAEVEDSGAGIDPAHLPRLFDPFFTTKPVGIGTGLGLSSAMGIVSALGGTIDVESTPGTGTIVRVRLPHLTTEPELLQAS